MLRLATCEGGGRRAFFDVMARKGRKAVRRWRAWRCTSWVGWWGPSAGPSSTRLTIPLLSTPAGPEEAPASRAPPPVVPLSSACLLLGGQFCCGGGRGWNRQGLQFSIHHPSISIPLLCPAGRSGPSAVATLPRPAAAVIIISIRIPTSQWGTAANSSSLPPRPASPSLPVPLPLLRNHHQPTHHVGACDMLAGAARGSDE